LQRLREKGDPAYRVNQLMSGALKSPVMIVLSSFCMLEIACKVFVDIH